MATPNDIYNEITRIDNAKQGIAEAIEEKGVQVPEESKIEEYPGLVRQIQQGSPDAVLFTPQVLTPEQQAQARQNIGATAPEIFLAVYGTTTASEIATAVNAGKFVVVLYKTRIYVLSYFAENANFYLFASTYANITIYYLTISTSTNQWSASSVDAQSRNNISNDIPTDRASEAKYPSVKAVFDSLGKWGVVSQTQTWTGSNATGWDYTMSDPVWGFIPLDFINTVGMFEAVFNESTGYFELNGLTDISYQEMRKIWLIGNLGQGVKASGSNYLQGSTARTNINTFTQIGTGVIGMTQTCGYWYLLEEFNYQGVFAPIINLPNNISWCFVSCTHLKKILPIGLNANNTTAGLNNCFSNCYSLEDIYIKNVKIATSFAQCPRLKLDSIVYIVQYAANTTAITITLHATAYARCQADTTEYTYNGQTYTGIIAYAAAKNITIASA